MRNYTTFHSKLGSAAQSLMLLGSWHSYDADTLRCRHGFRNTRNCPGCHGHLDYNWVDGPSITRAQLFREAFAAVAGTDHETAAQFDSLASEIIDARGWSAQDVGSIVGTYYAKGFLTPEAISIEVDSLH